MSVRRIARGLAMAWITGLILPGMALARAASTKEKTTQAAAIGLTAASAALLTKKKTRNTGIVVGAGATYAWKKHHDYVKQRHNESATQRTHRHVYVKESKYCKVCKAAPRGRAVGYYTRSAHSATKSRGKQPIHKGKYKAKHVVKTIAGRR